MQRRIRPQDMWKAAGVAVAASGLALVAGAWHRRRSGALPREVVPSDPAGREDLIDTTLDDSFPASDPPAYWARESGS